jgi:hypothetical protein
MQTVIATDREMRERPIPDELTLPMSETEPPRPGASIGADGADDEVVSPELVLVDPRLRHLLASRPVSQLVPSAAPPEPEPAVAAQVAAAGPPLRVAAPPAAAPPLVPAVTADLPRRRRWWPLIVAALAGGALAVAATIVLLPRGTATPEAERVVDPTTGRIGQPAASTPATSPSATTPTAPTTAPSRARTTTAHAPLPPIHPATTRTAPKTTPATTHHPKTTPTGSKQPAKLTPPAKPKPKPPGAASVTTRQKLAWAPAAGATAYDMELLRNTKRVFHARTSAPSIVIAVRKGSRGPAGSLPAGTYEWIVWPVVNGHRAAQAIVRSRLNLPG